MPSLPPTESTYDIEFFWDPVCPFAWITSRWVDLVAHQSDYRIDWRFISLRLLNKDKDYATEFPPEYDHFHTAGLKMLRVAAAVRDELGRDVLGDLVTAYGRSYWDQPQGSPVGDTLGTAAHTVAVLEAAGLPARFAEALDDTAWDELLDAETELAFVAYRARCRHADHQLPPAGWSVVLRPGDLAGPRARGCRPAVGCSDHPRRVRRFRRAQTEPA